MKPKDIAVGQIWCWSADRYEVLGVYKNAAVIKQLSSGKEFFHEWPHWTSAVLEVPKKKVYLSLWKNQSGYTWVYSNLEKSHYDSSKKMCLNKYEYTLMKEWELEYEPIEAS